MSYLEAVLLLTTSHEVNNGKFFKFCNQFLTMKKNNLRFHIFINNSNYDEEAVLDYISKLLIFRSVSIHNLNIPPELDIYIKDDVYDGEIPPLGLTSGPNRMFLDAITYCFDKFNTVLLLETDCILKQNCFEVSKAYIETISDFLISGSRYVGSSTADSFYSSFNLHLNGVAFYNTGCYEFRQLIKQLESFILKKVRDESVRALSYDYAFTLCVLEENEFKDARRFLSKFINTTFILNCSLVSDSDITEEEINTLYPKHIIFHTKRNY
jgi:hypothetical protein